MTYVATDVMLDNRMYDSGVDHLSSQLENHKDRPFTSSFEGEYGRK